MSLDTTYYALQGALAGLLAILAVSLFAVGVLAFVLVNAPPLFDDGIPQKKEQSPMSLFAKSAAGMNLSPAQRAALKLLEGLAIAAALVVLPILADALSSHAGVDWAATLHNALLLGGAAALGAFVKWAKAQGDSPLLSAAEDAATNLAAALTHDAGLNEPVNEPDPSPPSSPQSASLPQAA